MSEKLVLEVADALVSSGLRDVGYTYVNVDDCWMLRDRDAAGHLQVDTTKFPSGMKALGDELHDRGLLFGIYSAVRRSALFVSALRSRRYGGRRRATRLARGTRQRGGTRRPMPRTLRRGASTT